MSHASTARTFPTDLEFLDNQIKKRWDKIEDFIADWEERVEEGIQRRGRSRERATLYRWIKSGLPNREEDILGVCGLLDLDPMLLVDPSKVVSPRFLTMERTYFMLRSRRASAISSIWPLVEPSTQWPLDDIAADFFDTVWTCRTLEHDPSVASNCYARITLRDVRSDHQVFYIAYRQSGALDGLWRPYGVILRRDKEDRCIAENGYSSTLPASGTVLSFETHFGPGAAEFKIASLHSFDCDLTVPSPAQHVLRFVG